MNDVKDGETGFVTDANPEEIADAIVRFFQPGSLPHFQEAIKVQKQKYSWQTFTDSLFSLLK